MAPSATQSSTSNEDRLVIPAPSTLTHDTPALPPGTHAALVSYLRETRGLAELSALLQDSLARSGWTDRVRALTLDLIRSGEAVTFPALLDEVLRRAKVGPTPADGSNNKQTNGVAKETANGAGEKINGGIVVGADWAGPDGKPNVRIPERTVEVGVEFLKTKIRDAVVIVDVDERH